MIRHVIFTKLGLPGILSSVAGIKKYSFLHIIFVQFARSHKKNVHLHTKIVVIPVHRIY